VPEPSSFEPGGERFELVSRGDHVPGRVWWEGGTQPRAIVWIVPALGSGKDAREVDALARALVAEGFAAAAIDLPLQGERASAKLSARLAASAGADPRGDSDRVLWEGFLTQAVLDLAAAHRALGRSRALDPEALACVAFASGAAAAAAWAAAEPRLRVLLRAEGSSRAAVLLAELRGALAGR
jgi:dienelactone hydrolase